ncbi:MAG: hypothetical protein JEY79_09315 [Pseudodesulfovibrio sp.]|nr:hypothetical protein [Pseudodesulfovibrio sp.]
MPVDWSEIGVLTVCSGLKWTSLEALFNDRIGLISNYKYPKDIANMAKAMPQNVDSTPNELSLMRKLSKGRFTTAITDPTVMLHLAAKEGVDNIKMLKILEKKALVFAFKNSSKNLKSIKLLEKLLLQ